MAAVDRHSSRRRRRPLPDPDVAQGGSLQNWLLCWFVLVFLLLVPLPLGSNRPFFWGVTAVTIAIAGFVYGSVIIATRQPVRVHVRELGVLAVLFLCYCLYLFIQLLPLPGLGTISTAPGSTFLMLLRAGAYGVFFILVLQVARNRGRSLFMLDALLAINALHAVIGLVLLRTGDTIFGMQKWAYLGSATGSFVNRNSYATFLAFGCVLAAALLLDTLNAARARPTDADEDEPRRPWTRVAVVATAFAAIVATLVATQSRMGVGVALLGLVVVVAFGLPATRRLGPAFIAIGAAVALALLSIALLNSEGLVARLLFAGESWEIRSELYRQIIELIAQRPWTGFGGGSFEIVFPLVHDLPVGVDRVWDKAHNTYLALWVELGLIGGTILLVLFAIIALRLRRALRLDRQRWVPATVALGVIAVASAHSLVDFSLEIQAVTFWFVALVAIGLAQALARPTQPKSE